MGLIGSVTDPAGNTTRYWYNPRGQITRIVDAKKRTTKYRYNTQHRLSEIQQSDNKPTHYTYHRTGQVASITTPDGQTTHYRYTPLGLLESITDAAGRNTHYQYDGLSQIIQRTNPDGSTLQYEYDGERNLTALINEKGERYSLAYDKNERLIQEIGFDGRTTEYLYNLKGHLTGQLEKAHKDDPLPNKTHYQRDAAGRLLQHTTADGKTHFVYNNAGQLIEATNAHRQLQWAYDPAGRLIDEWQDQHHTRHQYDERGQRTHTRLPNGQQIKLNYDASGMFTAMRWRAKAEDEYQLITHLHHNPQGQEVQREHGNGLSTLQTYDPQGRLQEKGIVRDTTDYSDINQASKALVQNITGNLDRYQKISHKRYQYDTAGRLTHIQDDYTGLTQYHYDPLDRLTQVEGAHPEHILHDPANNVLAIHTDKTEAENQAQNAQIQNNRLQFQGDTHYQYDTFGNRVKAKRGREQKLETHYQYDAQHRLTQVQNKDGTTTFKYDALGRRTEKSHTQSNGQQQTITSYLWQGDQLLDETTSTNGKIENQQTYLFKPNSFEALALVKDEQVYSYHLDHLGTPEALTDEKGDIVWYVNYSAYGKIAVNHQADVLKLYRYKNGDDKHLPEVHQPLRFQGQYYDAETNLHYNRHRYYDPDTASFITQDPIKLLGGTNNYLYTPNPISWVDPSGLLCKEVFASIPGVNYTGRLHRMEKPGQTDTTWEAGSWNVNAEHRYSGFGLGAVYGGTTKKTALAEVEHYDIASDYDTSQRHYKYKDVSIDNMLDLTDPNIRQKLGVTKGDLLATGDDAYDLTNEIGSLAKESGFNGIIAPSARNPSGSNVVVFGGF